MLVPRKQTEEEGSTQEIYWGYRDSQTPESVCAWAQPERSWKASWRGENFN